MKNHLIKNIHIKNFKCFDDFKAEGFSRVNLIGGKNNVGKTAFLEAAFINVASVDVATLSLNLYGIKSSRELANISLGGEKRYLENNFILDVEKSNKIFVDSNKNRIHYCIEEESGVKKYHFEIGKSKPVIIMNAKDFSIHSMSRSYSSTSGVDLMTGTGFSNSSVRHSYSHVQKKDKEGLIDRFLNSFDSDIEAFKIINDIPQCKSNGQYQPVTEFGDGTGHLISILTTLFACESGYLFIDELDNGIHYTALDSLWEIILKLSKELNVQVFATTHSKECIESFNRVQLKLKNKESSYFELAKEKDTSKIFMRGLDSEQLEYELSHQGRYRGE